jgi:hypothetical protein
VPVATVEKVLALYREKYFDLNVRHVHEKLRELHAIDLSYSWVKSALQGAGLVARQPQRQKPTLPPRLEIPQTALDSHFPTVSAAAGD